MKVGTRASVIFNGRYTLQSPTGKHRTFKISTQPADAKFAAGKRVIALLDGPDNESNYLGFGFVNDSGIWVWSKHRGRAGSPSFFEQVAPILWSMAVDPEQSPWKRYGWSLLAEGACLRCNRPLTTPESILSGIGPICAEKIGS